MTKYIDVDALIVDLFKGTFVRDDLFSMGVGEGIEFAARKIQSAPAADVVEVVRCKDCKYYHGYGNTSVWIEGENKKAGWCCRRIRSDEEFRMLPSDFCSYGEKMEERKGV